jgi:hypothetical protein
VARLVIALVVVAIASSDSVFPDEDYISYGCHGGFTGGGTSTAILSDGRIYRSHRSTYRSEITKAILVGRNPDAARDLFLASARVDFLGSPAPEPKSYDCVIAKRIAGHTYGISVNQKDTLDAAKSLADLFIKLVLAPDESPQ